MGEMDLFNQNLPQTFLFKLIVSILYYVNEFMYFHLVIGYEIAKILVLYFYLFASFFPHYWIKNER